MIEDAKITKPGRPKDSAKHEEIIVAATRLFMEKGYELTSMEAVAREASVSKLTIYSHFADKNELFRAIIQYRCDKVCMPKDFVEESSLPVETALLKIARRVVSIVFSTDSLRLIRVLYAEAIHHPEIVQAFYEIGPSRAKKAFCQLLEQFNSQGKLSVPDPLRASDQFISLIKGEKLQRTVMQITPPPDQHELEQHITAAVAMFIAAYQNQENKTLR